MVFKETHLGEQARAPSLANEQSDQAISCDGNKSGIIYTRGSPESVSSMASSNERTDSSAPVSTSLMTATPELAPANVSAAANISIREYIYFLPYPLPPGTPVPYSIGLPDKNPLNLPPHQFEPTSTLVLTSPNRTFVDIRFFKSFDGDASKPLPNKCEKERLEWAFAGISESRPLSLAENKAKEEQWDGVTHSTWTHWLDSRHSVGSNDIPVDEGDMYPIAHDLALEHGHAFHPHLDAHKTHEEMWRDIDIQSTTSTGTKVCVVLRVQADAAGVRGVIIRVGQYCQGIVMQRDHCTVERWEYVAEERGDGEEATGWKRTARVGDLFLPCAATWRPEVLARGGVVKYHDYEWVVEEVWEWK